MIAFIRKDLSLLGALLVVGAVALTLILTAERFEAVWVLPPHRLISRLMMTWTLAGLGLGLFLGTREEFGGTTEYLLQRAISRLSAFGANQTLAALTLSSWLVVPFLISFASPFEPQPNRAIAEVDRWWDYLRIASITATSYAIGYVTGSAPGRWLRRLAWGALVGVPVLALNDALLRG
ncbi:MAG: hypothetical protein KDA28_13320, partial [Phycisphaerales bacterium]|nr:hypothetical protein [Phycisphaerales bacterium]